MPGRPQLCLGEDAFSVFTVTEQKEFYELSQLLGLG